METGTAVSQFRKGYFATSTRSRHTQRAYGIDLQQFAEFVRPKTRIKAIPAARIQDWSEHLRGQGYASSSIRRKFASLRIFFLYWVRMGKLAASPMAPLRFNFGPLLRLPKYLTRREMSALLATARRQADEVSAEPSGRYDRAFIAIRNRALVELLFATGIRVGEASALDLQDFCPEDHSLKIRGKGGRFRLAFLIEENATGCLNKYLEFRSEVRTRSSALFVNSLRRRLSTQGMAYSVKCLAERASLEKRVTPHMLRHTAATFLLRNGADLRLVQEFLGHASIVTTQRYTHVTRKDLIAALHRFHPGKSIAEVT